MCDYFEHEDDRVTLFYPGLRPSGNTVGAIVKLWVDHVVGAPLNILKRGPLVLEPGISSEGLLHRLESGADPVTKPSKRCGVFL
jgi:hypothetical protein